MLEVTEIGVILAPDEVRLKEGIIAFVNIVLMDSIAIKDIRVLEKDGKRFLGMPAQKLTEHCDHCRTKNFILDNYCCRCGNKRVKSKPPQRVYKDLVYPINQEYREYLSERILEAYDKKVKLCQDTL